MTVVILTGGACAAIAWLIDEYRHLTRRIGGRHRQ